MKKIVKFKVHIFLSLIALLLLSMVVNSSLAWQDVSQHKTSNFYSKLTSHSVVLVENFKPITQWKLNDKVVHEISVRNGQETDDVENFSYNDGFIRLQLREFMGIASENLEVSSDRLMVDSNDEIYRFATELEANNLVKDSKLSRPENRVVKLTGIDDKGVEHFYIKIYPTDKNAHHGKYLVLQNNQGDLISITNNQVVTGLDDDVANKHNNTDSNNSNIEDTNIYTTHLWDEKDSSFTPNSSLFKQYVEWKLGKDVITLNDWIDKYDSKPIKKWIVDTRNIGEGWVYWGDSLIHSNKNDNTENVTSMLLETIQLVKQPAGRVEYRIHVNMDAVSYEQLSAWQNAPQEIISLFETLK